MEAKEISNAHVPSEEQFFENEVLRDSHKDLKNLLENKLDNIVNKEEKLKVKPRYSRLKNFQSVKSSDGN